MKENLFPISEKIVLNYLLCPFDVLSYSWDGEFSIQRKIWFFRQKRRRVPICCRQRARWARTVQLLRPKVSQKRFIMKSLKHSRTAGFPSKNMKMLCVFNMAHLMFWRELDLNGDCKISNRPRRSFFWLAILFWKSVAMAIECDRKHKVLHKQSNASLIKWPTPNESSLKGNVKRQSRWGKLWFAVSQWRNRAWGCIRGTYHFKDMAEIVTENVLKTPGGIWLLYRWGLPSGFRFHGDFLWKMIHF